jgi:hypothetical protein
MVDFDMVSNYTARTAIWVVARATKNFFSWHVWTEKNVSAIAHYMSVPSVPFHPCDIHDVVVLDRSGDYVFHHHGDGQRALWSKKNRLRRSGFVMVSCGEWWMACGTPPFPSSSPIYVHIPLQNGPGGESGSRRARSSHMCPVYDGALHPPNLKWYFLFHVRQCEPGLGPWGVRPTAPRGWCDK